MGERTLVLVRHGKSRWGTGLPDFDRPLNDRGLRDAPAAGAWIAGQGLEVDAAVISPSVRTRETWALLAKSAGIGVQPAVDRGIYLGEAEDLADALRGLGGQHRCAVLVGHSPGCADLVEYLTAGRGDSAAQAELGAKYPTCGIAVLAVSVPWRDLEPATAKLEKFAVPRG